MLNVIAIIPARGGSKGVPRKNIRLLGDKPLIAWTIETSLRSKILDRVIVSTDDHDIAELSVKVGAEIPFLRPSELAKDDTPDLPVYLHILDYLAKQENYHPDVVVWLRPTSPLRLAEDVENTVNIL
ncbi:MAG: cytidylyltransferase domain-containing protein, partial [Aphanizomenon sp.]